MMEVVEEVIEDGVRKLEEGFLKNSTMNGSPDVFDEDDFFRDDFGDDGGCKVMLYRGIGNSDIRAWDLFVLLPNLIFFFFLLSGFNKARRLLASSNAPIFRAFYALVLVSSLLSLVRCVVSMIVAFSNPASDVADKILWIALRFVLLATEISVLVFGVFSGHLDSRRSIRRVVIIASLVSSVFSVTQAVLELRYPDRNFRVFSKGYDLFGHGGMIFWLLSCLVFASVYLAVLILPCLPLKAIWYLPQKRSFYYYTGYLFLLNVIQSVGCALVYSQNSTGMCLLNFTTYLYFTMFTPIVYFTFLKGFFNVPQPTLLFSYKAQVDDEDPAQSLDRQLDNSPIIINSRSNNTNQ